MLPFGINSKIYIYKLFSLWGGCTPSARTAHRNL